MTLPKIPYASEIDLIRDGQLVPEVLEIDGQKVRTLSLVAVVQPEEAEQKVTWSSDAPAVARVNQSGVVTLLTSGPATITATAADGSGITAQVMLNVSVPDYAPPAWGNDPDPERCLDCGHDRRPGGKLRKSDSQRQRG